VPIGSYDLIIVAAGFKKYQAKSVKLEVGQKARADVALQVGAISTGVTVEGSSVASVETQSSDLSGTFTGKEISQLELNGRNFTQLATLVPGVSNQSGQDDAGVGLGGNVSFSMNGGRTEYNNWELDSGDNMDNGSNTTLNVYPSLDGGRRKGDGGLTEEIREIQSDAPPGEDKAAGIWALRRGTREEAGQEETRQLRLSRYDADLRTQSQGEVRRARTNDEEAVSQGPDGNRRMVPGKPPRTGGRATENPQRQAPGPLPVLRTTDELPQTPGVLSGGLSYLAEVAQSTHSWKRDDVGEVYSHPTATPAVATTDLSFLDWCREPRLRNPLR